MSIASIKDAHIVYLAPFGLPKPEQTVILFVHGLGGSSRQFEEIMNLLAPNLFPIAIDLPGHGDSEGIVPVSVDGLATIVDGVLSSIGVSGSIYYVGHSFGGLIGLRFAALHPRRVGRMVLIATTAKFRLHPDFVDQASSGRWDFSSVQKSFPSEVPQSRKQIVLLDLMRFHVPSANGTLKAWAGEDAHESLKNIRTPTLVVVPDADVILSPRHGRALAARCEPTLRVWSRSLRSS